MIFNETGDDPRSFHFSVVSQRRERASRSPIREDAQLEDHEWRASREAQPARSQSRRHLFMTRELAHHNRPVFDQLHPNVYKAAVGLIALFVLAAWILFDRQNDIGLPLAMVSVLLLVAVLLPWSLSLVWQKYETAHRRHPEKISYRDWKIGDFAVWGSKLRGTHAAIDMLLPLAAVAFGLTALGIVFVIVGSFAR